MIVVFDDGVTNVVVFGVYVSVTDVVLFGVDVADVG